MGISRLHEIDACCLMGLRLPNLNVARNASRLKRSFIRHRMSLGNAKQALQATASGLLRRFRGRCADVKLHQGGRRAVHYAVRRKSADQGAGGQSRSKVVRATAPVVDADGKWANAL